MSSVLSHIIIMQHNLIVGVNCKKIIMVENSCMFMHCALRATVTKPPHFENCVYAYEYLADVFRIVHNINYRCQISLLALISLVMDQLCKNLDLIIDHTNFPSNS